MQDLKKKTSEVTVSKPLSVVDHDRQGAGLLYVYPVVSRRAGGVSIGVNLNINNACNWRCVYCQVPDLTRGAPPPVDLVRLRQELKGFLDDVLHGDFLPGVSSPRRAASTTLPCQEMASPPARRTSGRWSS